MTLYEMLDKAQDELPVWIFRTNDADQNIELFKGTIGDARSDGEEVWEYLLSEIDFYSYKYGLLDIRVVSLDPTFILPGSDKNKNDRIWKFSAEIDKEKKAACQT